MKKIALTFTLLLLFVSLFAQKPYKGGEIYSKDKVLYGKFEMRMKMIKGSGLLSTFYTIEHDPGNAGYWAELDIEVLGKNNAQTMSTNIITDASGGGLDQSVQEIYLGYSLADGYHTYTLEWTQNYVAWYIDGIKYREKTGAVIDHLYKPQGYRFNAWVSCTPGWVGYIEKAALPRYQYVDWIEYHSYDTITDNYTFQWRDDFNSFNTTRWAKAQWTFDCNEVDFVLENAYTEDGKLVLAITDPNPAPLGISENSDHDYFSAIYLPSSNEITIDCFEEGDYKTQLYDISGKVLFSKQFNTSSFSIPCENIPRGLYIICVKNKGLWTRQKIFIQ